MFNNQDERYLQKNHDERLKNKRWSEWKKTMMKELVHVLHDNYLILLGILRFQIILWILPSLFFENEHLLTNFWDFFFFNSL